MQRNALSRSSLRRSGTPATSGGGSSGDCCADWNLSIGRYFFVDPVNGNDSNEGWIDAALGSTFTPAQTSVVAIRTHARLMAVLPSAGDNRIAICLIAPGTYSEAFDWRGKVGYQQILRRGSDLTNSASDRVTCGFVTALAGPGASGEFTVAAASTVDLINISAGAFTAEPGILGYRIRFTGNVSAALANVCRPIYSNTASSLVPESSTGTAPAVGDTFFIERPGVICSAYYPPGQQAAMENVASSVVNVSIPIVGIRVTTTASRSVFIGALAGLQGEHFVGFEQTGVAGGTARVFGQSGTGLININASYIDEAGTTRTVGMSMRHEDMFACSSQRLSASSIYDVNAQSGGISTYIVSETLRVVSGYMRSGLKITSGGVGSLSATSGAVVQTTSSRILGGFPSTSANRPMRFAGPKLPAAELGTLNLASHLQIADVVFENAGAFPAISVVGDGLRIQLDGVTGSTGNTDVGIDLTGASNCTVLVTGPGTTTLTGTLGDIRLAGPAITTLAGLALTNVVDSQRNNIQGAAGQVVDVCKLVTNSNGSALAVGQVVQGNGTTNQVRSAIASSSSLAHVSGVMVTPPANGVLGYMACAGSPYVLFDAAPTPGAIAYLDDGTTGTLSTTAPANALLVGRVISASGSTGRVAWHPQNAIQSSSGASEDDIVLHEPFILTKATDNPLSLEIISTAGGGMDQEIGVAAHQGVASIYSVLVGFTLLRSGNGEVSFLVPPVATGIWTYDWIFNLDQLSTVTNRFVLHIGSSDDSVTFANAVECKYSDNINGGNFQLRTAAAGTPTVVDSGVAVAAATWYYMRLEVTQEEVRLYVDTVRGTRTLRATSNTNIPTVGQMHMFNVETTALVLASIRQDVDDFKATFHFN